jgi:Na+-transporting methylmalonyl-CoA/oxaloacetate decarboxylase gamma subunit
MILIILGIVFIVLALVIWAVKGMLDYYEEEDENTFRH